MTEEKTIIKEKPARKKHDYVDNKKLLAAMIEHRENVLEAKKKGLPPPRISEYIGECIYLIALNYSYDKRFMNYPFVEELVMDGVENCIKYSVHNFDPAKSGNVFGYFSLTIFRAFLRRIKKEKKLLEFKKKYIEMTSIGQLSDAHLDPHDRDMKQYVNTAIEYMQDRYDENDTSTLHEVQDGG